MGPGTVTVIEGRRFSTYNSPGERLGMKIGRPSVRDHGTEIVRKGVTVHVRKVGLWETTKGGKRSGWKIGIGRISGSNIGEKTYGESRKRGVQKYKYLVLGLRLFRADRQLNLECKHVDLPTPFHVGLDRRK